MSEWKEKRLPGYFGMVVGAGLSFTEIRVRVELNLEAGELQYNSRKTTLEVTPSRLNRTLRLESAQSYQTEHRLAKDWQTLPL